MDLVDLYHLRGVSLVRSKLARTPAARCGYGRLARRYADRIEHLRSAAIRDRAELAIAL